MLPCLKTNIKIAFFIGCITFFSTQLGFAQNPILYKGIINSFKLNIREKPSMFSNVVVVVVKGETVDVIEKDSLGGWLMVVYRGNKGYIWNRPQYIELLPVPKKIEIKSQGGENIQTEIQSQKKLLETFSQKEIKIIEGLNEIDYALNKARITASTLSTEIIQLEGKIGQLNQDWKQLSKEIAQNHEYAGKRLRAFYKMNMIGRFDVAGLASSVFDFFLQQNSMKHIVSSDFDIIEKQNAALEVFALLEKEIKKEIQAKTALETELTDQIRINKIETLKKESILQGIRQKKKLSLAAVESLKLAALQLDQEITSLQKVEVYSSNGFSFSNYEGQLILPVRGEIISEYGPSTTGDYKTFTFQKGIDIKVERGEPVKSVFKGEVMFSQWLKGYGNLLIIDHGDNYYTLYAHIEEIFKQKGEHVETGEVIATAGDTGYIKGTCLHFEVRHHGKSVDPMKWLRKGA